MSIQPSKSTKQKHPYFSSSKKDPLARKMIFDSHEPILPAACFNLRPVIQSQSNQQQIIFEQKSSSIKEVFDFESKSPNEFDKIIYELSQNNAQNQNIFLETERSDISSNEVEHSQNSNSLKRALPLSSQKAEKYEDFIQSFQISEQSYQTKKNVSNFTSKINNFNQNSKLLIKNKSKLSVKSARKRNQNQNSKKKLKQMKDNLMQNEQDLLKIENSLVWPDQQIQKIDKVQKLRLEKKQQTSQPYKKKIIRKFADKKKYQLVKQFTELMSYSTLIETMITVYDRSPLFENPLDFDSQPEEDNEEQHKKISLQNSSEKLQIISQQSSQVRILDTQMELQGLKSKLDASLPQNNQNEHFSMLDKIRINKASNKNKKMVVIKEIQFQRTQIYRNFYEVIRQIKPYIKKMTLQQKELFLTFKKELQQTNDIIEYFGKIKNSQNREFICKICEQQFKSGRQLGNHMSRNHPAKGLECFFKRKLFQVKQIERNRRKYFKNSKKYQKSEKVFKNPKKYVKKVENET